MADFGATDLDAFRKEVREWVEANFPAALKARGNPMMREERVELSADQKLWRERVGANVGPRVHADVHPDPLPARQRPGAHVKHAPLVRRQRWQIAVEQLKAPDALGRGHQAQRRPRDDAALAEAGADAVKEIRMFGCRTAHLIPLARHHIHREDVIGLHAMPG